MRRIRSACGSYVSQFATSVHLLAGDRLSLHGTYLSNVHTHTHACAYTWVECFKWLHYKPNILLVLSSPSALGRFPPHWSCSLALLSDCSGFGVSLSKREWVCVLVCARRKFCLTLDVRGTPKSWPNACGGLSSTTCRSSLASMKHNSKRKCISLSHDISPEAHA